MNQDKRGLNYVVCGNKNSSQNLVFVHGSGCNRKFLKALADKLDDYKCYLIDLPDHGESPFQNVAAVDEYIDAAAMFAAGLKNVTLIGHSLGGTVCLGVAAKMLPSVKRSVIISSAAKYDRLDPRIHAMLKKQKTDWPYIMKCLGSFWNLDVLKCLTTMEKQDILLKDFKIDVELDIWDRVGKIKTPVLIMVGDRDILTIPEYSYELKKALKHSKVVLVEGYRHMLPVAAKGYVSKMIRKFIQKTC